MAPHIYIVDLVTPSSRNSKICLVVSGLMIYDMGIANVYALAVFHIRKLCSLKYTKELLERIYLTELTNQREREREREM